MARNTQPVLKRCRTLGVSPAVMGYSRTSNKNPGGQRRTKKSEYATQLTEKQKVKFVYGIQEKQFRAYYEKASKMAGNTGEELLTMIERRLDNVVYRLGFASTRREARQLVNHGHIEVNGKKVDIPSAEIKPGSVISVREKARNMKVIAESLESNIQAPAFVEVDKENKKGTYVRLPERSELNQEINESLVVEYYNR